MYISDQYNHRIRKVTVSTGIISTIAGTGTASYSGDGGAATSAALSYPFGITLDSAGTHARLLSYSIYLPRPLGNLFLVDFGNFRIRKVTLSTGIISTFAGSGNYDYSGDEGAATAAALRSPAGVAIDSAGIRIQSTVDLYIFYFPFPPIRQCLHY